jgi:CheY-like chemotaxis protein
MEPTVKSDTVTSSRIAQAHAGKTVLVVDDEAGIREVARKILERAGLRVIEAEDGIQALRLLETIEPDLLLTDIRMPGMDGIALAQGVARRSPAMPILLMSGFINNSTRTILAKADGFIQKPFSSNALVRIVFETLRRGRT